MSAKAKSVAVSLAALAAGAAALGGRLVGWEAAWQWFTGWWTPGWGNLFTVIIAAAAVVAAIANNRISLRLTAANFERAQDAARTQFTQARADARIEKLRTEIAALVTAIDEQSWAEATLRPTIMDAMAQVGLSDPQVAGRTPPATEERSDKVRRGMVLAQADFEVKVSPIFRRIATHAFGVLMLTDDPRIIEPVERLARNTAAEWDHLRAAFTLANNTDSGTQFVQGLFRWGTEARPERESRLTEIDADRAELRSYSLQRFCKLEPTAL